MLGRLLHHRLDALLGALALAFGLPSLLYPYGRDQGLFFYAAREWLLRGQVLYRDVWDHKPPVIYFLHMLSLSLFGETLWGIRVLELCVAVPLLGFAAARLATPRGEPLAPGVLGASWLGASVLYYGWFDYWHSGQCEIWGAIWAVAALASILRFERERWAWLGGGFFCALALFTKPPSLPFVLLASGALVLRVLETRLGRPKRLTRAAGMFALGGLAFGVPLLALFAAKGALRPMLEILVGANSTCVAHERGVSSLPELFWRSTDSFRIFQPFSGIALAAAVLAPLVALARRDRAVVGRYLAPLLLLFCAWLGVVMQLKFYHYHWGAAAGGFAVLAGVLYQDLQRLLAGLQKKWLAPLVFVTGVFVAFIGSHMQLERYYRTAVHLARRAQGKLGDDEYALFFDIPSYYSCRDPMVVGKWLKRHAAPGDTLAVRGFEPEVYAWAGLHYTGRFYWTTFLTHPGRAYRRDALVAEDRAVLEQTPPRWVVTINAATEGLDSAAHFLPLGYRERFRTPTLTVLERAH